MKDKILMPRKLTAENGAKKLMIGEFFITRVMNCSECNGTGDVESNELCGVLVCCESCDGEGYQTIRLQVDWPTIKEIYAKAVEHFGEEP